jgi:hypothetical protein
MADYERRPLCMESNKIATRIQPGETTPWQLMMSLPATKAFRSSIHLPKPTKWKFWNSDAMPELLSWLSSAHATNR